MSSELKESISALRNWLDALEEYADANPDADIPKFPCPKSVSSNGCTNLNTSQLVSVRNKKKTQRDRSVSAFSSSRRKTANDEEGALQQANEIIERTLRNAAEETAAAKQANQTLDGKRRVRTMPTADVATELRNSDDDDSDSVLDEEEHQRMMERAATKETTGKTRQGFSLGPLKERKVAEGSGYSKIMGQQNQCAILPDSTWRKRWNVLIMIATVYYGIQAPITIGFSTVFDNPEAVYAETVANCLFIIDVVFGFFTPFRPAEGPNKGILQFKLAVIAKHYLRSGFIVDLLSALPIDVILLAISTDFESNPGLRLLRVYKLIRVMRIGQILDNVMSGVQPAIRRLIVLMMMLVFMWHWIACFYWSVASIEGYGSDEEGDWLPDEHFETESFFNQYPAAFFWAVVVTTGVGDLNLPKKTFHYVFTTICIITGVLLYAIIIGSASTALADFDNKDAEKRRKIEQLKVFMAQRTVSNELQKRIIDYYEYVLGREGGDTHLPLLDDLHIALKHELNYAINREIVQKVPIFSHIDVDCMLALIEKLGSRVYLPDEYVIVAGEEGTEMFFVLRGLFEVLSKEGILLTTLGDGTFFGEKALLSTAPRNASVRSAFYGELLVLSKLDLAELLLEFPELAQQIRAFAPDKKDPSEIVSGKGGNAKLQLIDEEHENEDGDEDDSMNHRDNFVARAKERRSKGNLSTTDEEDDESSKGPRSPPFGDKLSASIAPASNPSNLARGSIELQQFPNDLTPLIPHSDIASPARPLNSMNDRNDIKKAEMPQDNESPKRTNRRQRPQLNPSRRRASGTSSRRTSQDTPHSSSPPTPRGNNVNKRSTLTSVFDIVRELRLEGKTTPRRKLSAPGTTDFDLGSLLEQGAIPQTMKVNHGMLLPTFVDTVSSSPDSPFAKQITASDAPRDKRIAAPTNGERPVSRGWQRIQQTVTGIP